MILDNLFKIIKSNFDEKNNTPLTFEKSSVRGEWKFEYTIKKLEMSDSYSSNSVEKISKNELKTIIEESGLLDAEK